mmetsp:Transcript_35746/g.82023  ORF Transcript_35746/g.82023 Transcript_35746/m.82023 type:complete len:822 (-) Transcript_35746:57-2522(-)
MSHMSQQRFEDIVRRFHEAHATLGRLSAELVTECERLRVNDEGALGNDSFSPDLSHRTGMTHTGPSVSEPIAQLHFTSDTSQVTQAVVSPGNTSQVQGRSEEDVRFISADAAAESTTTKAIQAVGRSLAQVPPRYPILDAGATLRDSTLKGDNICPSEPIAEKDGSETEENAERISSTDLVIDIPEDKKQMYKSGASRRRQSHAHRLLSSKLDLYPVWDEKPAQTPQGDPTVFAGSLGTISHPQSRMGGEIQNEGVGLRSGDAMKSQSQLLRITMRPTSKPRLFWDMASIVVVGYDALFIPLLVFGLAQTGFFAVMNWFTAIFWSLDVVMSVLTGYNTNGLVEMRLLKILQNYLRSWFGLDMLIVVSDWVVIASTTGDSTEAVGIVKFSKSLRITRILRLLRLLRMIRVSKALTVLRDSLATEESVILWNVMKVIVAIVLVNHYIGCCWYGVGVLEQDLFPRESTWVKTFDERWGDQANFAYTYTTCLHWSLTQFTPATMEVLPTNPYERVYAILVLVFALVAFSSLLTSINAAMTQLRKLSANSAAQEMAVIRYMTDKRLSIELGHRVWDFLRKHRGKHEKKKTLHEVDVEAFKVLPETLRVQLHLEVYSPCLLLHPLFHQISIWDEYLFLRICNRTMTEKSMPTNQELFIYGQKCEHVYFLQAGEGLYYRLLTADDPLEVTPEIPWESLTILCEMALWVKWQHQGRLVAQTRLELYAIKINDLHELINISPDIQPFFSKYARGYLKLLREDGEEDDERVATDVWVPERPQSLIDDARPEGAHFELARSYTRGLHRPAPPAEAKKKLVKMASTVGLHTKP